MSTSSPVVETVSRKRTVPPEELQKEKSSRIPEFWEYIESLKADEWVDHIVYLYRQEPKTTTFPGAPPAYLDKYVGTIEVRPGFTVPMDDAGTIQQAIKEKFGGRVFRLILKKGKERLTETTFSTEAPPKYPDANPSQYPPQHPLPNAQTSDVNTIAAKAIDTVAGQPQEVMNIAINALRASAEMIARSAQQPPATNPQPPPATAENELDKALRQAMIAKLLAPPPDPLESLKQFAALRELFTPPANSVVDKLVTTALDRFMNPAAPTGKTTLLDLGRELIPVLGSAARETMHEYRLSVEAQARIAELQRGIQSHPAPAQVNPLPAPAAAPPAQPGPQIVQPPPKQPTPFPQIEAHIAKIITNSEYSVDEMVDNVLSYLYDEDPRLVAALLNPPTIDPRLKPGKEGLMQLFTYEPALQPCLNNLPRLSDFLDKFIVAAKQAEAAQTPAQTPA